MIVGFNTDIKHGQTVYHVQTEDKGLDNPVIESLIYVGGAILDSKRLDYSKMLKEGCDEDKIMKLMEGQHRRVIRPCCPHGSYLGSQTSFQYSRFLFSPGIGCGIRPSADRFTGAGESGDVILATSGANSCSQFIIWSKVII